VVRENLHILLCGVDRGAWDGGWSTEGYGGGRGFKESKSYSKNFLYLSFHHVSCAPCAYENVKWVFFSLLLKYLRRCNLCVFFGYLVDWTWFIWLSGSIVISNHFCFGPFFGNEGKWECLLVWQLGARQETSADPAKLLAPDVRIVRASHPSRTFLDMCSFFWYTSYYDNVEL
jgi:hypothetical protein